MIYQVLALVNISSCQYRFKLFSDTSRTQSKWKLNISESSSAGKFSLGFYAKIELCVLATNDVKQSHLQSLSKSCSPLHWSGWISVKFSGLLTCVLNDLTACHALVNADIFGQCESLEMQTSAYVTQWSVPQSCLNPPTPPHPPIFITTKLIHCLLLDYAIRADNTPLFTLTPWHPPHAGPLVFSRVKERGDASPPSSLSISPHVCVCWPGWRCTTAVKLRVNGLNTPTSTHRFCFDTRRQSTVFSSKTGRERGWTTGGNEQFCYNLAHLFTWSMFCCALPLVLNR